MPPTPIREYRQSARSRPLPARKTATTSQRNVDVYEYEQQGNDSSSRRPVNNLLNPEAQAIKSEVDRLDRELAVMREGPFGPNSEFIRSFPPDEREELLKALEAEGVMPEGSPDLVSEEDIDELVREEEGKKPVAATDSSLKVTLSIPVKDKIYIKRFNTALQTGQEKAGDKEYFALWKWYLRCQQQVANFGLILPEDVWHFLWKSQSSRFYRPKHIAMLGKDMIQADITLEDKQWLEYIDALQATGNTTTAAETWEAQRLRLGANADVAELFWNTGVRLYVQLGQPQKAQRLAFECYEHTTMFDPDILVMVISAWAKSQNPAAAVKTWSCYLKLREKLKDQEDDKTTLRVLGRVSGVLLEAQRQDLALAVFKDMFLLTAKSHQDSLSVFRDVGRAIADSQSMDEGIISQIGLSVLAAFPRTLANKYFFAAWIKWLLGEGKTDDAAMVVELAYERGVKLDAGPLNGLIAAWFRQGLPDQRQRAEQSAWAMIQSRIEMAQLQQHGPAAFGKPGSSKSAISQPSFLKRGAPAATIETFSVLLQHYTRRSDLASATHLTDVMTGPAKTKPNSFIMNHWLYASLRSGKMAEVWTKYTSLKHSISPDLETFAALWDTAKAAYAYPSRHQGNFPVAQVVFTEMKQWFEKLDSKKSTAAQADFSAELYEQIIRCFCLSYDLHGTLCAMHGLKQTFGALPQEEISRLIIMLVARAYASDFVPLPAMAKGLRLKKNLQYQSAVRTLTEIVVNISDKMVMTGDFDPVALQPGESPAGLELRLSALTAFLCLVIEKRTKDAAPTEVVAKILQVAEEMQVSVPVDLVKQREWGQLAMG